MKIILVGLCCFSVNAHAFGDLEILNDLGLGKIREIVKTTEIVTRQLGGRVSPNNSARYNRVYGNAKRLPDAIRRQSIPDTIQDIQNIFKEL